ncbi:MAG: hypothetical protein NC132_02280 [Corallococcus sp.]|nr:hypothetical protein [Corallococcus sp.]MCM1358937.1 hypothetical protein [Corallococcus sp.]MCM1394925.1 hypothetical protein [Corallococcus sp.]
MKKSVKITLITVGIILCAIFIVVIGCSIFAHGKNDDSQPTKELSSWMSMIKDETPLKNVAIPGAHDAGTAGISYLAETQDRNTFELLACGTRYLDLRVTKSGDALKIFHGPFKGVTLQEVMSAAVTFLKNNPTETLILDFQHFEGGAQKNVFQTIESYLQTTTEGLDAGLAVTNATHKTDAEFVDALTLGECRGKCLVLWGEDEKDEYCKFNYIFKRNNDAGTMENCSLQSYYESSLNKKSSANYMKNALPHYVDLYKKQNVGLFVLQGQLTDGLFVFGPRFREAQHCDNMNDYVKNLYKSDDIETINIIIRDFVSPSKNALTINLNEAKGIVKPEYAFNFAKTVKDNLKN